MKPETPASQKNEQVQYEIPPPIENITPPIITLETSSKTEQNLLIEISSEKRNQEIVLPNE